MLSVRVFVPKEIGPLSVKEPVRVGVVGEFDVMVAAPVKVIGAARTSAWPSALTIAPLNSAGVYRPLPAIEMPALEGVMVTAGPAAFWRTAPPNTPEPKTTL